MNKDLIKPILDELGIKPIDSWITIHRFKNGDYNCYYHVFNINKKGKILQICVSGDGISYVCSDDTYKYYYMGYNINEFKKVVKKLWQKYNIIH